MVKVNPEARSIPGSLNSHSIRILTSRRTIVVCAITKKCSVEKKNNTSIMFH